MVWETGRALRIAPGDWFIDAKADGRKAQNGPASNRRTVRGY